MSLSLPRYDVVVVGGGHNGLVSAAYLARAGMSVLVLERLATTGGAAVSGQPFAGLPAQVSSYAPLVGHFPDRIVDDLGLDLRLRPRRTASYTPLVRNHEHAGLLVEREPGRSTADSFAELTGSEREYDAWRSFTGRLTELSDVVTASVLDPLPARKTVASQVDPETWHRLVEQPLGIVLEEQFVDDAVRGLVASDALVGTFTDLHDPGLEQNRCLLHHALGPGPGRWQVPTGGMGAVAAALESAVHRHGGELLTHAFVTRIESDDTTARVAFRSEDGEMTVECSWVLADVAPWVVRLLLGENPGPRPEGSLLNLTMVLDRLPRLRSGASSPVAFAGTVRLDQGYHQLQQAFREASEGSIPAAPPGQLVCPSLIDPSVLGTLAMEGKHVLNYLGLHTPARLYAGQLHEQRDETVHRILDGLNTYLEEPVESLLSLDENGHPCLTAQAPQDVEAALAMPGGHMFHGPLQWPWADEESPLDTPAQRWGVETSTRNVLLCGAGARRGGTVSGIAGHNAAMAVLDSRGRS